MRRTVSDTCFCLLELLFGRHAQESLQLPSRWYPRLCVKAFNIIFKTFLVESYAACDLVKHVVCHVACRQRSGDQCLRRFHCA